MTGRRDGFRVSIFAAGSPAQVKANGSAAVDFSTTKSTTSWAAIVPGADAQKGQSRGQGEPG
jgi:hypothetical protein